MTTLPTIAELMARSATAEKVTGTKEVAARITYADLHFELMIREIAGFDEATSIAVRQWMGKNKLTKLDLSMARINVKHGAYLDRDVLERIAAETKKPTRKSKRGR